MSLLRVATLLLALLAALPSRAEKDDRARMTTLADRYVAEFHRAFPETYEYFGLPARPSDGTDMDINSPADIARWHKLAKRLARELATIRPDKLAGGPEWATWQFLKQAFRQDQATTACRNELWSVSAFGWQASLTQLASIQTVGTDEARARALARWRAYGSWIDQEIANLKEGQRLGYAATDVATRSTLDQLDQMLAETVSESGLMDPATRDQTPAFAVEWKAVIEGIVWPALARYRDYLRDEYLPRARKSPSLETLPNGRQCYVAQILAVTTATADPDVLFDLAVKRVERERRIALELGRGLYGDRATDWNALAELMRADPQEKFASAEEVRAYTQRTYERAEAAAGRMVLTPPVGKVVLEPFPEFQQESAPAGQYLPAANDGSRPATYLYRNVTADLYRSSLQNVIFHETLPGHHLQVQFLAKNGRKDNHLVSRMLVFSGPGEGWATYSEGFARELGLYDSDRDYIGTQMGSITPMMVAELGMQVKGWTPEQAIAYLQEALPLRPPQRAVQTVAVISSVPGFVLAYPLGGMMWDEMRQRAELALGDRFDVRAFHQALLEDGMLPFGALEAKLDRWIASQ